MNEYKNGNLKEIQSKILKREEREQRERGGGDLKITKWPEEGLWRRAAPAAGRDTAARD
jgi:hypothetical protein